MTHKTISIITGTVRDEGLALEVVKSLLLMREHKVLDSIIVSTWEGELACYPRLHSFLMANEVYVIENTIQLFSIFESHQKILILSGLSICGDDDYVTRHRFDRIFPSDVYENYLSHIKNNGLEKVNSSCASLTHKITVNTALIDTPFYFNDMIFSGLSKDIIKLCSLDLTTYLSFNSEVNPELSFFTPPFVNQYPSITDYLSTYPGLTYGNEIRRQALKEIQVKSEFYARIFALYVFIAKTHFNIGYGLNSSQNSEKINLDIIFLSKINSIPLSDDLFFFNAAGHIACKSNVFFHKIYDKEFKNSFFSEQVGEYLTEFDNQSCLEYRFLE